MESINGIRESEAPEARAFTTSNLRRGPASAQDSGPRSFSSFVR
jgi:hypothetical protein